jgi:hypothetical protein
MEREFQPFEEAGLMLFHPDVRAESGMAGNAPPCRVMDGGMLMALHSGRIQVLPFLLGGISA